MGLEQENIPIQIDTSFGITQDAWLLAAMQQKRYLDIFLPGKN